MDDHGETMMRQVIRNFLKAAVKEATNKSAIPIWVCLKIGYIPNEIAIFHRDNDQQNHWVQWGTLFSDTPMYPKYCHIGQHLL